MDFVLGLLIESKLGRKKRGNWEVKMVVILLVIYALLIIGIAVFIRHRRRIIKLRRNRFVNIYFTVL